MRITGVVTYVFCADAGATADWLSSHFGPLGFHERQRWYGDDGHVTNVEIAVPGGGEIWLDGPVEDWSQRRGGLPAWTGFSVDDIDELHGALRASGLDVDPPRRRPFGVSELVVTDPEGHQWGFVQRHQDS